MSKAVQSIKSGKEIPVKAQLRFINHVKVKKAEELKQALEKESLKPQTPNAKGYFAKIYKDRIEFFADRNEKRPPIKKIKYSKVERIIPIEESLCFYMGCRQGKTATVTSFGLTEAFFYSTLMDYLAQTRGLAADPKSTASQAEKSSKDDSLESQDNMKSDDTTLLKNDNANFTRTFSKNYTTSYVFWEEIEPANPLEKHAPVGIRFGKGISVDPKDNDKIEGEKTKENCVGQTDVITDETPQLQDINHCPCCIQNSGINLELKNHSRNTYAPSSIDCQTCSNLPTHFPQDYKCYRPSKQSHRPEQTVTEDVTSVLDESTFGKYDNSEPIEQRQPNKRHRSQPPPSTKSMVTVGLPVLPRPPHLPIKIKPSAQRSTERTLTAKSSSSSGYTSDTIHEDGLELKVNPSTSEKYIRDKKRAVTGRVKGPEGHRSKEPQTYYYRKNNSGLPRYPQLKIK